MTPIELIKIQQQKQQQHLYLHHTTHDVAGAQHTSPARAVRAVPVNMAVFGTFEGIFLFLDRCCYTPSLFVQSDVDRCRPATRQSSPLNLRVIRRLSSACACACNISQACSPTVRFANVRRASAS
jgi:hypothetical protein